jgi:thiol-disulfide isomerase/thioredoxin
MVIEQYRKELKAELAKKMINKPSPAFVLKDEEGRNVFLNDFKGKAIVLDFWATWCIPCKKSFPAMQMAVDRYKGDDSVKFLFIHTWDRGTKTPLKDAATYLHQNKYDFDLYMDYKDPLTEKHPAVSNFGVTGIPTKFIIDGNGNIRFKVDGFSGTDEAAAEEIITMIELAKTAK